MFSINNINYYIKYLIRPILTLGGAWLVWPAGVGSTRIVTATRGWPPGSPVFCPGSGRMHRELVTPWTRITVECCKTVKLYTEEKFNFKSMSYIYYITCTNVKITKFNNKINLTDFLLILPFQLGQLLYSLQFRISTR